MPALRLSPLTTAAFFATALVAFGQGNSTPSTVAALKKTSLSVPKNAPLLASIEPTRSIGAMTSAVPKLGYAKYPWKLDIVATVFWVGEEPTENNPTPNDKSSWDTQWMQNYGGYDDPDGTKRTDFFTPVAFTPKQNPFYIALPYNDVIDYKTHKPEASKVIPWFSQRFSRSGRTVLKGQWVAIKHGNRVCYAQWEDCGPFVTDDHEYVFGNARPKNASNNGAGIDISPAIRDYLGLKSMTRCDWRFVDVSEVPSGPWRTYGSNNHFVRAQKVEKEKEHTAISSRLDELRRMRDAYFQSGQK